MVQTLGLMLWLWDAAMTFPSRENPKSLSYLHTPLLPHGGGRAGEEARGDRSGHPSCSGHAYRAPHNIKVTEWGGQSGNFLKSRDDRMFDLMCHGKWEDSEACSLTGWPLSPQRKSQKFPRWPQGALPMESLITLPLFLASFPVALIKYSEKAT